MSVSNTVKVLKNVAKPAATKAKDFIPKAGVNAINKLPKQQKNYFQSLGVKFSEIDDSLTKAAEGLIPDGLKERVHNIGHSKVALDILKSEGKDYGSLKDMHLVKAASILGTRLALINREYGKILGGLSQLKEI